MLPQLQIKRCLSSSLLGLYIIMLFILATTNISSSRRNDQQLSMAHFQFSVDLYKSLLNESKGNSNLVFSPYSVNVILAMIFLGTSSSSNSSRQLRSVLHLEKMSYVQIHKAFKYVIDTFDKTYYLGKMKTANGLFFQQNLPITPIYKRALKEFYRAKIESVNFADPKVGEHINEWVRDITEDKIPQILDAPPSSETQLIIINSILLEAKWLYPFKPEDSFEKGLFFLQNKQRMEVPMMYGRHTFPIGHSEILQSSILEIPFTQRRMSLFIILPENRNNGMNILDSRLNSTTLRQLFSFLKDDNVNVRIPRFRIKTDVSLQESLQTLGIVDIFDLTKSDLSLLTPERHVKFSTIAHKAGFEASESGSSGYAATAVSLERTEISGQKYFEVDRPFLFLVWDYHTGMFLLMGRVMKPDIIPRRKKK